jgi:tRNA uridine 5-carboxymethylaminomethyl modification enzyme
MYNGNIQGIGPRYCPSIEDKIGRFPDKLSHHVFVEPEGADSEEIYPNGISTSLPLEVQKEYVQTIAGFEDAIIVKAGYAVEYDFVLPDQLTHALEVQSIPGLFLAGQINGTTGYEEAAGQGIIAGINAHLKHSGQEPFIIDRTLGYIGIMIDDLVTMSVDEPYRMFTSRAERRLVLRQDNAFLRLTDKAHQMGLIDQEMYQAFAQEKKIIQETLETLRAGHNSTKLLHLYGQTEESKEHLPNKDHLSDRAKHAIYADIHYGPYLQRELTEIKRHEQYKALHIPADFNYANMPGLSKELQQKLIKYKPQTIAQVALIQGMTPAALSLLIAKIRAKKTGSIRV